MPFNPDSSGLNLIGDHDSEVNVSNENHMETDEETIKRRGLKEAQERKMRMIKKYCCKSYIKIFYRDKSKPKLTCTQIFCGNFLKARMNLLRFKISWDYLVKVEQQVAPKIFIILAFQIVIYFTIGLILPFLASFLGKEECSSVSPLYVYAAYAGFIITSTFVELGVLMILRKAMIVDGKSMLPFNRYLLFKWFQGQFANFVYFFHFCFVASALMCLTKQGGVDGAISNTGTEVEDPLLRGQLIMRVVSSILAIIATPILVISNIRRVYWTGKNFQKHPDVHKLLPNMQRNT